jgi:hypothetical protein
MVCSPGSQATPYNDGSWRLDVPAQAAGKYRLAQLDDYSGASRGDFPWRPPLTMSLKARASAEELPGTWGFGLWNDPFSLALGFGGGVRRFPAMPNAAWFFYASPDNYLSFRDDLPAQGFLAATFRASLIPAPFLAVLSPALVLFALPVTARILRRLARFLIRQDAVRVDKIPNFKVVDWHDYQMTWTLEGVSFTVDGERVLSTSVSPHGPLGLVLWIDNQYAALLPNGRLSFGNLPFANPAWIEIRDFCLELP